MNLRSVVAIGRVLQRIEEVILAIAILLIAGLTMLNVFCRSLLGFSLAMVEEVSQFSIIVVCFVGLSYAAGQGRHIRMTAVYDQLALPLRKALMTTITAATSLIMFVLAWYAVLYVRTVYQLGGVYPALRVPFYCVYAVAPLGLFLAAIQYALAAARNLTSERIFISVEKMDAYHDTNSG